MANEKFILKYAVGNVIKEKWKLEEKTRNYIRINKFKIHYFYSKDKSIEELIDNAEIKFTLMKVEESGIKKVAEGSTILLSKFAIKQSFQKGSKNSKNADHGKRESATILLFF